VRRKHVLLVSGIAGRCHQNAVEHAVTPSYERHLDRGYPALLVLSFKTSAPLPACVVRRSGYGFIGLLLDLGRRKFVGELAKRRLKLLSPLVFITMRMITDRLI
jgi:hypothetical protein